MSGGHLPAKTAPSGLAFDPRTASPMIRRGMERLIAIVAAKEDGPKLLWSFVGYGHHKTYEREPPTALPVLAENIPEELKQLQQWVCWDYKRLWWDQRRGEWRWSKPPIDPKSGGSADEHIPDTWTSFADAVAFAARYSLCGVGFVFTDGDPYIGVNLNDCWVNDGSGVTENCLRSIEILDSYTEWSPTGSGVHVVVRGSLPDGVPRTRSTVSEVYGHGQFFTFTGHLVSNGRSVIQGRQDEMEALHGDRSVDSAALFLRDGQRSIHVIEASPDSVAVGCWDGHYRFLELETGIERWSWCWENEADADPVVMNDIVIGTIGRDFVARGATSGEVRWSCTLLPDWRAIRIAQDTEQLVHLVCQQFDRQRWIAIDPHSGAIVWQQTQVGYESAVNIGNTLYVAGESTLARVDPYDGTVQWSSTYKGQITDGLATFKWHIRPVNLIEVDGVVVLLTELDGFSHLTGFDVSSGTKVWTHLAGDEATMLDGTPANVVLYALAGEPGPHILDPRSGDLLWCGDTWASPRITPSSILVSDDSGSLYALDVKTGGKRWCVELVGLSSYIILVSSGIVLVRPGRFHFGRGHNEAPITAFDEWTGEPLWSLPNEIQSVLYHNDLISLIPNALLGVDLRTGVKRWSMDLPDDLVRRLESHPGMTPTLLSIVEDTLLVATDHSVHAFRIPS